MRARTLLCDECTAFKVRAGTVLACTEGMVWFTFEADGQDDASEDRFLTAGVSHVIPARGTVFVSGMQRGMTSTVQLQDPSARWRSWLSPPWQRA